MKTAYELLMSAPDDQVTRCKIVMRAIIAGNWEDAAFTLTAAANEATGGWADDAKALADHCRTMQSRNPVAQERQATAMTAAKHTLPEIVKQHCGRINTDILSGWEKGIGPMRKIGRRLGDHYPPEHLTGQRYWDWKTGYDEGKRYKAIYMRKHVFFSGRNADGEVVIRRTGWNVPRGVVLTQMERKGCSGDVTVHYFNENSEIVRTIQCDI